MVEDKVQEKLADYVEDAHAMERNDLKMVDSMIATTDDPETRQMLHNHKRKTEEHERRMRERLEAMGRGTSARKQDQAVGAALLKGMGDKAGKNARDGYRAEYLEIAAYQLLERLAERAGDAETAEAARLNRADEEEMARRIDQSWDRTLDLTLEENTTSGSERYAPLRTRRAGVSSPGPPSCLIHGVRGRLILRTSALRLSKKLASGESLNVLTEPSLARSRLQRRRPYRHKRCRCHRRNPPRL
jgi:ferritin-like metal-binding protein YciE